MWFAKFRHIFQALTSKEQRLFGAATLVGCIALVLFGFHLFLSRTVATPAVGGRYTEGVVGQPVAVNPVLAATNEVDQDLTTLLFSGLGELAERIQSSEDHKIWTATLKEGLLWSDETPLTSDDVIFTLATITNPETRSPLLPAWQGVHVERLSGRELRFTLRVPYAFFEENLRMLRLLLRHCNRLPQANWVMRRSAR